MTRLCAAEIHNFSGRRSFAERDHMLTQAELTDARAKLSTAKTLIEAVKLTFLGAGNIEGARLLNEVAHLLDDEIAALVPSAKPSAATPKPTPSAAYKSKRPRFTRKSGMAVFLRTPPRSRLAFAKRSAFRFVSAIRPPNASQNIQAAFIRVYAPRDTFAVRIGVY